MRSESVAPARAAGDIATLLAATPAALGTDHLVCIDGPAGSGKTTLSAALATEVWSARVVHCDEMLAGWGGLSGLAASVSALVTPLAAGGTGRWRRWDWVADGWAEEHEVAPGGLLVLEGVGSWSPEIAHLVSVLAWVEAESEVRLQRGLERDGEQMREHWERWRREEDALHARLRTRDHADVLLVTG